MFCSKCGKQLSDDAVFCSGCGNPVGAAQTANSAAPQAPAAAPASLPLILKRLFEQIAGFFTKKDPVGVISHSATDSTWSGAILLGFGAIITAVASMVNFNQGINMLIKELVGGEAFDFMAKEIAKFYPSGATLGLSFLGAVVIAAASVGMIFVGANFIAKKRLALYGAVNMVAYASIPLVSAFLLNMILGLIWLPLAITLTVIAALSSLLLLYSAFRKACGFEDAPFGTFMIVTAVIAIVAILFSYIWINGGIESIMGDLGSLIGGGLGDLGSLLG